MARPRREDHVVGGRGGYMSSRGRLKSDQAGPIMVSGRTTASNSSSVT
jgi:hypothetical protein